MTRLCIHLLAIKSPSSPFAVDYYAVNKKTAHLFLKIRFKDERMVRENTPMPNRRFYRHIKLAIGVFSRLV